MDDAVRLVEEEVDAQAGVSGLAVKGAYRIAKGLRSDFTRSALETLFPSFIRALVPLVEKRVQGQTLEAHFSTCADEVADALLSITDDKIERSGSRPARGVYFKIRGSAKRNVEEAAPKIGRLLDAYAV